MQVGSNLASGVWVLLGAFVGALTSLFGVYLTNRLASQRERQWFRVKSFDSFRLEFKQDKNLESIKNKHANQDAPWTSEEINYYLGFFEEVGLYASKDLVDVGMIDEILGDYILECYDNNEIMKHVSGVQIEERQEEYFEHFETLAKELARKREQRRERYTR